MEFHRSGHPPSPASIRHIPRDVSDAILAGLARNPADRPASAIAFTRRFHNAVDAEFLALRRSKAFLLQHLADVCAIADSHLLDHLIDHGADGLRSAKSCRSPGYASCWSRWWPRALSFFPIICFAQQPR